MNLRQLLLLPLILLLPVLAPAQRLPHTIYLTADTSGQSLSGRRDWRIITQDIPNGAEPALDDNNWPLVDCELPINDNLDSVAGGFHGFAWLRLHLWIDSTMASKALALAITQLGASEVYVDGRLIKRFGEITPATRYEGYDPQRTPIAFQVAAPGAHVLAIRYANPNWQRIAKQYVQDRAGLHIGLGAANSMISDIHENVTWIIAFMMVVFGIFAALAMVHLVLFLFYRADRSNLLFSLFTVGAACCFLLPVMKIMGHNPDFLGGTTLAVLLVIPGTFCMLSILISLLFRRRRWPVWIVIILYSITALLIVTHQRGLAVNGLGILVLAVVIQAFVDIIIAMWRRVPGARILGAGILLFTGSLIVLFVWGTINDGINLSSDTLTGQISIGVLVLGLISIPVSMSAFLAWGFARVNRNLTKQLIEVRRLSDEALQHEVEKQQLLETRQEELEREVTARTEELRGQKRKSDDLLLNILPIEVAEELKETGASAARLYDDVSVLFTDFVDFTQMSEQLAPAALVAEIDACFKAFDGIIGRHGLEKIKTVGDAYIAVSGLPVANADHAALIVRAALDIRDFMAARKATHPATFGIRLGVHSGPVVAGIVGIKKFAYDIWGDTVNTAARMEQASETGKVNISATTYDLVKDAFTTTYRGKQEVKHKGMMGMYFVEEGR